MNLENFQLDILNSSVFNSLRFSFHFFSEKSEKAIWNKFSSVSASPQPHTSSQNKFYWEEAQEGQVSSPEIAVMSAVMLNAEMRRTVTQDNLQSTGGWLQQRDFLLEDCQGLQYKNNEMSSNITRIVFMMSSFKSGNFFFFRAKNSRQNVLLVGIREDASVVPFVIFLFLAKEFRKAHIKHRGHNPFWLNLNNARHKHPQIRLSLPLFGPRKEKRRRKFFIPETEQIENDNVQWADEIKQFWCSCRERPMTK